MVAAKLKKQLEGPAKEKQKSQGINGSKGGRGKKKTLPANLPEGFKSNSESREQAAAMLNVSGRNLSDEQKSYLRGKRYQQEKKRQRACVYWTIPTVQDCCTVQQL